MPVDKTQISVRQINKKVAKDIIEKYHYTHNVNGIRYALGVFKKSQADEFFGMEEELIGTIIYAHPVSNKAIDSICGENVFDSNAVLELTRLYIKDTPDDKNIESYVISESFHWIRKNDPKVKVLISYADPEAGHTGAIYRATNWIYQGCGYSKLMPDYSIKLSENGMWIHSRTVGAKWGHKSPENLAQKIGHTFWRKEETAKHRYIYFVCSKKEKKQLLTKLKIPSFDYSTIKEYTQLIQKIHVKDGIIQKIEVVQGEGDGLWTNKQKVML